MTEPKPRHQLANTSDPEGPCRKDCPACAEKYAAPQRPEESVRLEQAVRRLLLRNGVEFDATIEQIVDATAEVLSKQVAPAPSAALDLRDVLHMILAHAVGSNNIHTCVRRLTKIRGLANIGLSRPAPAPSAPESAEAPDYLLCDNQQNHPAKCHCSDPLYWKQRAEAYASHRHAALVAERDSLADVVGAALVAATLQAGEEIKDKPEHAIFQAVDDLRHRAEAAEKESTHLAEVCSRAEKNYASETALRLDWQAKAEAAERERDKLFFANEDLQLKCDAWKLGVERLKEEISAAKTYMQEAGDEHREWKETDTLAIWVHNFGMDAAAEARSDELRRLQGGEPRTFGELGNWYAQQPEYEESSQDERDRTYRLIARFASFRAAPPAAEPDKVQG